MSHRKLTATIIVLGLCILSVFAGRLVWGPKGQAAVKQASLRSRGHPSAALWVVEYMDYQCPSCRSASAILDGYVVRHPHDIYVQVKFFPLKMHAFGLTSALYSECASRQNKFWPLHTLLFENQPEWTGLPQAALVFRDYAQRAGVDMGKLDACVEDKKTGEFVMKEKAAAEALGVNLTPTFFFNGKMVAGRQAFLEAIQSYFPNDPGQAEKK